MAAVYSNAPLWGFDNVMHDGNGSQDPLKEFSNPSISLFGGPVSATGKEYINGSDVTTVVHKHIESYGGRSGISDESEGGELHNGSPTGNDTIHGTPTPPHETRSRSPSESSSSSVSNLDLAEDEVRRDIGYSLRAGRDKPIPTTWVDKDDSGNYDPDQEAAYLRSINKSRRRKKKPRPKQRVEKLIVGFKVQRIGDLRSITDDTDNWPEHWSDATSGDEGYVKILKPLTEIPEVHRQTPIPDPAGKVSDLTGHPAAAGCVSCRSYLQSCSIVRTGVWPCEECVSDGIRDSCQLITEPKFKRPCQRCEFEGIVCDFQTDPKQRGPCAQCVAGGNEHSCIAGPMPGRERVRLTMDSLCGSDRKHVTCTSCRQQKRHCSLKKKEDAPPCTACKRANIGCTFFDVPLPRPKSIERKINGGGASLTGKTQTTLPPHNLFSEADWELSDDDDDGPPQRASTPSFEMADAAGNVGKTKNIWTSFCHPITFNSENDCSFCEFPLFGFVGHFEKRVAVIDWYNGLGYSELGGGFIEDERPTCMCNACVSVRLQIMWCEGHQVGPLNDKGPEQNHDEATMALMDLKGKEAAEELKRWCSFCYSLATYQCCTLNESVSIPEGFESAPVLLGCGLRLCDACEIKFRELFGGNVHEMALAFDQEPKPRGNDDDTAQDILIRADVGFLRSDGLLIRNVLNEMRNAEEDQMQIDS